jgi:hypothetical protein
MITGRTLYIICGKKQLRMKIVGFWDVMCNLVEGYQHFWETCYLHSQGSLFYPEDGRSRFLRNVSTHLKTTWCHIPEDLNLDVLHTAVNTWNLTPLYSTDSETSTEIKSPRLKMLVDTVGNTAKFLNKNPRIWL